MGKAVRAVQVASVGRKDGLSLQKLLRQNVEVKSTSTSVHIALVVVGCSGAYRCVTRRGGGTRRKEDPDNQALSGRMSRIRSKGRFLQGRGCVKKKKLQEVKAPQSTYHRGSVCFKEKSLLCRPYSAAAQVQP